MKCQICKTGEADVEVVSQTKALTPAGMFKLGAEHTSGTTYFCIPCANEHMQPAIDAMQANERKTVGQA